MGVELRAFGFDRSPRSPNVCMSIESLANSQGPRADTIFYTVKIVSALGPLLNSLMCLHELLEVRGLHGYMVYMNYMIYIKHGLQNLLKSQPLVYKTCSWEVDVDYVKMLQLLFSFMRAAPLTSHECTLSKLANNCIIWRIFRTQNLINTHATTSHWTLYITVARLLKLCFID